MTDDPASDREQLAAEYVLGTLPADERAACELRLGRDPALAAAVRFWEDRLTGLAEAEPAIEPRPHVWSGIAERLAVEPPRIFAVPGRALVRLTRARSLWRAAALGASALAAGLALFIASERVGVAPAGPALIAVVNRSGELPALIVRVDTKRGLVEVRSVAAEVPAERSLELWSIVGDRAPRSLGIVDASAQLPLRVAADGLGGATLAVTVEPKGGSPSGAPTGPVVYSGKLIAAP
jgi:anti-sigma-K factor RskA